MVVARRLDRECIALQRQGELTVYPGHEGQEAAQVGSAWALGSDDFVWPTFRELPVALIRGVDAVQYLQYHRGTWHGGPYDPRATRFGPICIPIATQISHAAGYALGRQLDASDDVTIAYFGDGATSEGDFHEALNFAAVLRAPVVFFVQNNEYAISVPLAKQTAAPSLAHKGIGYGIPGERVDGNDAAALLAVLGSAVSKARAGEGPQLIEAHTYRVQAHTNADDATRYRDESEVTPWLARDPLTRLSAYLGVSPSDFRAEADRVAAHVRDGINVDISPDPASLFADVFATPTPQLREQAAFLADEISREVAAR
jgi:pyruvate dehydrogenase E1 component alpha subunit